MFRVNVDITSSEMPILNGRLFRGVPYGACLAVVDIKWKCVQLSKCEECFKHGVFCRALPEVCPSESLRRQWEYLNDANDRDKLQF